MDPAPLTIASEHYTPVSLYCGLRDQIQRLPKGKAVEQSGTIAALMESGHRGAAVTLVTLFDGTTSLYFSSGGGVIGAGQHKPVAAAALEFLRAAGQNTSLMQPTETYPLPQPQHARFYVLSASGAWTAEAPEQDLAQNRHPLSRLFFLAHAVITAVRQHSPPRG